MKELLAGLDPVGVLAIGFVIGMLVGIFEGFFAFSVIGSEDGDTEMYIRMAYEQRDRSKDA
jgi:hypothetical protein